MLIYNYDIYSLSYIEYAINNPDFEIIVLQETSNTYFTDVGRFPP